MKHIKVMRSDEPLCILFEKGETDASWTASFFRNNCKVMKDCGITTDALIERLRRFRTSGYNTISYVTTSRTFEA